ncbi:hypothetical protein N9W62_00615 [Akkermansiaceae bacterium]|nr:hypothetical protein [Akkermansiaceae bacterium]
MSAHSNRGFATFQTVVAISVIGVLSLGLRRHFCHLRLPTNLRYF